MKKDKHDTYSHLEILVDRAGIPFTLQLIAVICKEKATKDATDHDYYDSCSEAIKDLAETIKKIKVNAKY